MVKRSRARALPRLAAATAWLAAACGDPAAPADRISVRNVALFPYAVYIPNGGPDECGATLTFETVDGTGALRGADVAVSRNGEAYTTAATGVDGRAAINVRRSCGTTTFRVCPATGGGRCASGSISGP